MRFVSANRPYSSLAQSVEHLTVNQGVTGSSPVGGAIFHSAKSCQWIKKRDLFKSRLFYCQKTHIISVYSKILYRKSWTKMFHFRAVIFDFSWTCRVWTETSGFWPKKILDLVLLDIYPFQDWATINIIIKRMETDEEIKGKAFVHFQSWQEAYSGIVKQA